MFACAQDVHISAEFRMIWVYVVWKVLREARTRGVQKVEERCLARSWQLQTAQCPLGVPGALCLEACVSVAQYRCVGRCPSGARRTKPSVGAPFREFSQETWEYRKRMENYLTVINQKNCDTNDQTQRFRAKPCTNTPLPVATPRPPAITQSIGLRRYEQKRLAKTAISEPPPPWLIAPLWLRSLSCRLRK